MRTALAVVILAACNNSATPVDAAPDAAPPALAVAWTPCTLATAAQEPAECATVIVPYRWDDPTGPTIELAVKRYHTGTSTGQLWFVQGGPGGSDRVFDGAAEYFAQLGLGFDYYMLDQRGTGSSTRLGCPAQEALGTPGGLGITDDEWPACLAAMQQTYEPTLAGFTVTNTARDLGELITATQTAGAPTLIYGVSYGTYLVNRYLQLYPDQPTGVVVDSICGLGNCDLTTADAKFDQVAHDFMTACGSVATCSAHLGADPWAKLGSVLDALDAGHCPEATAAGLTRPVLRHAFAQLLYHWEQRILIPAITYRLDRCAAADIPVLQHFGALATAPLTATGLDAFSPALFFQIGLTELWDDPSPSAADFAAAEAQQLITNGVGAQLAARAEIWPSTPRDDYVGKLATTSVPMLMLGGSLDPATPLAFEQDMMTAFSGPHQTFVSVPRAGHGVLVESPTPTSTCGLTLARAFFANPTAPLDTSCTAAVAPLTFDTSTAAMDFLGTADLWGDP